MKLQKTIFFALVALIIASVLFANLHTPQGPAQGYHHPIIKNTNF